jgi:hypothetical protein
MRRIWPIGIIASALVTSRAAMSQELRGTVTEATTNAAIPGAVIMLLDQSGNVLGRNLTNERGVYRIALSPTIARMRIVRIGFRPREVAVPALPSNNAVVNLDVTMVSIPALLEPVRIVTNQKCPDRSDQSAAFSLLEQARAGLLATVVAREAHPGAFTRLVYDRVMKGNTTTITRFTVHRDSTSRGTASFVAANSANVFTRDGFVRADDSVQTYYAPDAEVLLDDAFARDYCFRVMKSDSKRPSQVGLGFARPDHAQGRIDIDGAVWVDTTGRRLTDIEFDYIGLDRRLEEFHPGGTITFREMSNGIVLVEPWSLRLVQIFNDTVLDRTGPVVHQRLNAQVTGGEIARADWPDGATWRASLGTFRARALTTTGVPHRGGEMRLVDTDYRATSDDDGRFEIGELLPGPYALAVDDARLHAIELPIPSGVSLVARRGVTIDTTVRVPTAENFVAERCRQGNHLASGDSLFVLARVFGPDGHSIADAEWTVSVQQPDRSLRPISFPWRSGTDGLLHLCAGGRGELQRGDTIVVEVSRPHAQPVSLRRVIDNTLTVIRVLIGEAKH